MQASSAADGEPLPAADVSELLGDLGAGHDAQDAREPQRVRRAHGDDERDGAWAGSWPRLGPLALPARAGKCDGKRKGCKVEAGAAALWNDRSREWWRKLNRVAKLRADRALGRLGSDRKGGLLVYEWEVQGRGVWHLHVVVGMETAIERAWAFEYVRALRELGPRYGFGFVDLKPLHRPEPGTRVAGYLSKYLAKRREDGTLEVSETVRTAGRTLVNFVSRRLTARSGCTMRALRNARTVWAWREGHFEDHRLSEWDYVVAVCLLDRRPVPLRGP